jgi:hypothetical protein
MLIWAVTDDVVADALVVVDELLEPLHELVELEDLELFEELENVVFDLLVFHV